MELWVRSQDKMLLTKVDRIVLEDFDNCEPSIYSNDDFLGKYKSKERALEVLDEIQEYINNNCEFIERKAHTKMGTYNDKIETYVYEMPKE